MKIERSSECRKKLERMHKTLTHQESDRIPVSDSFWQGFIDSWRKKYNLGEDADINKYYDLDYVVTMPNCDPYIRDFEVTKITESEWIIRTGFNAHIKRIEGNQMPNWIKFETDSIEKLLKFEFDDPWDDRRFFSGGNNQIAGVEENFNLNVPPWIETLKSFWSDFPMYGSLCEAYETLWRIIGSENALLWIAMYPGKIGEFIMKINDFAVEFTRAQIQNAKGMLDGMMIWGDVAYNGGMLFSPDYWRTYIKPGVQRIIEVCHESDIPVIYHGCGNVKAIFKDFIEIGTDAYNPLQENAGMDVIDLRRNYGHQICFSGNMGVGEWGSAGFEELKKIVLTKLNAGKGGGYIFQSDNSVPDTVSVEKYEYVLNLVRQYGSYPLKLGVYDLPDIG